MRSALLGMPACTHAVLAAVEASSRTGGALQHRCGYISAPPLVLQALNRRPCGTLAHLRLTIRCKAGLRWIARDGQLRVDFVEKLRLNEWTPKFSITTAVTIRFCTNLHARSDRKRLSRSIFHASDELKFSSRVFNRIGRQAALSGIVNWRAALVMLYGDPGRRGGQRWVNRRPIRRQPAGMKKPAQGGLRLHGFLALRPETLRWYR